MIYYTAHIKFLLFAILFFGTAAEIFAAEGDLDPSFDSDGIVITDNDLNSDSIRDLAVQPDGKIIAVGISFEPSSSLRRAVIVRYLTNGSIDSTFGASGKVIIPSVFLEESVLQTDGKIVFAGYIGTSPNLDFYVTRLNSDGSFDTTFNGTGAITLDLRGTSADFASSVKIQPDGKIVVGGSASQPGSNSPSEFAIVRLNTDGSLDATFDGDGKVFTPLQETAGSSNTQFGTWFILQSTNGAMRVEYFGLETDTLVPADYDGDGKADIAVWRPSNGYWYWISSRDKSFNSIQFGLSSDKPAPGDYDGDGKTDFAVFRPSNGVWYLQQSSKGFRAEQFGLSTDIPIPNVFVR